MSEKTEDLLKLAEELSEDLKTKLWTKLYENKILEAVEKATKIKIKEAAVMRELVIGQWRPDILILTKNQAATIEITSSTTVSVKPFLGLIECANTIKQKLDIKKVYLILVCPKTTKMSPKAIKIAKEHNITIARI